MDITEQKKQARRAGFARRKQAYGAQGDAAGRAAAHLLDYVESVGAPENIAAYMPIRTELDPLPAMRALVEKGHRVAVPVIVGTGLPLSFREWRPDSVMVTGPFGAQVPQEGAFLMPDLLVVPLVAFDDRGYRMGYGGGFYDRSLELLRAKRPTLAAGYGFSAQKGAVPVEKTDQPLDAMITENGVLRF